MRVVVPHLISSARNILVHPERCNTSEPGVELSVCYCDIVFIEVLPVHVFDVTVVQMHALLLPASHAKQNRCCVHPMRPCNGIQSY